MDAERERERESCEPSFAAEAGHSSEEVSEIQIAES
jgi:hypothetical protein